MNARLLACLLMCGAGPATAATPLDEKVWIHGSPDCASNQDPAIEVLEVDEATYVLRQNKCVHFEAPFSYVLFGTHTVFVQDTGATADAARFPLYETVRKLIEQRGNPTLQILVSHSHSHGDHTAADSQFRGQPGVKLIEPNARALRAYFGFKDWPEGRAEIDLGGRRLTVLPTPGHQEEALAVHDPHTGWLLTGDTFYPGRVLVKHWAHYRDSIARLLTFATSHRVTALLGSHIEMSRGGVLYPVGSTFQPDEASLSLTVRDLAALHESLQEAGHSARELKFAQLTVTPIGAFQKLVGGLLKSLGLR